MKIGAIFPQTEIGPQVGPVRECILAVESLGFDHLAIYDHVLGADISTRPDWRGPYTSETLFHEVMVLYGYAAAITTNLELVTSIVILPQRQTALVAKQAAEIDILSGGRLRLGVGLGWNDVEYESLGENFRNRGRRIEEQVDVLRRLWTDPVITYRGRWHTIEAAGIQPLPIQRPIPIWMGAASEPAIRRAARIADGWFPQLPPNEQGREMIDLFRNAAHEAGRDSSAVGIEGRIHYGNGDTDRWRAELTAWQDLGARYVSFVTMRAGFTTCADHNKAFEHFKQVANATL